MMDKKVRRSVKKESLKPPFKKVDSVLTDRLASKPQGEDSLSAFQLADLAKEADSNSFTFSYEIWSSSFGSNSRILLLRLLRKRR